MSDYKRVDASDILAIRNIIRDDTRVLYADNLSDDYGHDELGGTYSMPDIVVRAKSPEEISKIMKYASYNCIPVTPRGAGTGLVGSSVAMEHGIMLDTTLMNNILELDD